MTQAARKLTFEEYASLDAEDWVRLGLPEGRCEFWDGELIELPNESRLNLAIAKYIMLALMAAGVDIDLIYTHALEIEVPGRPRTRYPDLMVIREEHLEPTIRRALIRLDMAPPQMVAEVVSPGSTNRNRDYEAKRKQYQNRGIPEYWLIEQQHPKQQTIKVLELKDGKYGEFGVFGKGDRVSSPTFGEMGLECDRLFLVAK